MPSIRSYLSEISVNDIRTVDIAMHVSIEPPAEDITMRADVTVSAPHSSLSVSDDHDAHRLEMEFTLEVSMYDDVPGATIKRMHAKVTNWIIVSCEDHGRDEPTMDLMLRREALSLCYSNASAQVLQMTRLSPMGGFVVPPANPDELLNTILVADKAEEEK